MEKIQIVKIKYGQYLLTAIFLLLLAFLATLQIHKNITQKIHDLNLQKEQKIALENRMENLEKLEAEFDKLSPDIEYINNLLPSKSDFLKTIQKLESLASENRVDLAIKFQSEGAGNTIPTQFILNGAYPDLINFYKSITIGDLLMNIRSVDFTSTDNLKNNAEVVVEAEVYFDPE